ncbi:MAG: hypothetical protein RLZZ381_3218 [Cyanobacteriota bacterium]|jgi:hypothetical protein
MSDPTSKNPRTIRYVLTDKSCIFSGALIEYLEQTRFSLSVRQQIDIALEAFYLPLSLPPEHPKFKEIVVQSLSKLKGQVEVIETLTGISLPSNSQSDHLQALMAYPPQYRVSNTVSSLPEVTQATTIPVETKPSNTIEQVSTQAVKPQLSQFEELQAKIVELLQELADGEEGHKIIRILNELQPDDEDKWSEEMWDLYDQAVNQVSEANYQATFNPEN